MLNVLLAKTKLLLTKKIVIFFNKVIFGEYFYFVGNNKNVFTPKIQFYVIRKINESLFGSPGDCLHPMVTQ